MRAPSALLFTSVVALACAQPERPTPPPEDPAEQSDAAGSQARNRLQFQGDGRVWRVRGGVFESVHESLRVPPVPGWELILPIDPQLWPTDLGFGLFHRKHAIEIYLTRPFLGGADSPSQTPVGICEVTCRSIPSLTRCSTRSSGTRPSSRRGTNSAQTTAANSASVVKVAQSCWSRPSTTRYEHLTEWKVGDELLRVTAQSFNARTTSRTNDSMAGSATTSTPAATMRSCSNGRWRASNCSIDRRSALPWPPVCHAPLAEPARLRLLKSDLTFRSRPKLRRPDRPSSPRRPQSPGQDRAAHRGAPSGSRSKCCQHGDFSFHG